MATTTLRGPIKAADMTCMWGSSCHPHGMPIRKNL